MDSHIGYNLGVPTERFPTLSSFKNLCLVWVLKSNGMRAPVETILICYLPRVFLIYEFSCVWWELQLETSLHLFHLSALFQGASSCLVRAKSSLQLSPLSWHVHTSLLNEISHVEWGKSSKRKMFHIHCTSGVFLLACWLSNESFLFMCLSVLFACM